MGAPSNSIGQFQIGVSQIGDIPAFDVMSTVISQYANSPILMALVQNFSTYFDQTQNAENFYDMVFNVVTAQGTALDALGRVVGVQRVLPVLATATYLGFSQQGVGNVGNFSNSVLAGVQPLTNNYALSDSAFRTLIMAKAAFNLTDCTAHNINLILQSLFPNRGQCYVVDNGNMSIQYKFLFSLSSVEQSIVVNSGVLPRPSGVAVTYSY